MDRESAVRPARVTPGAVFWDMDGTLLDSEPLWDIAVGDLAVRHGIMMTPALREATFGNALPDALRKVYEAAFVPEQDRDFDGDARWLLDRVTELFTAGLPWRPGARAALDTVAAAGIPMVLVTNTVRELTDVALLTLGPERFVHSVCGDEVPTGKPAPDPYLRAAELVGLDPAACLVIEDSPTGADAATAAGIPALIVPSLTPVARNSLRTLRPSLVGLTAHVLADAWAGQRTG